MSATRAALEPGDDGRRWARTLVTAFELADRLCRRRGVLGADRDDFRSWALVRLVDDDYAILRKFRGESSLRTYLAAVLVNLLKDWLNARFGKWRSSAPARRAGPAAVALEALVYRDGLALVPAVERLRTEGYDLTIRGAAVLLQILPRRSPTTFVGPEALVRVPDPRSADDALWRHERWDALERAREAIDACLSEIDPEDRLVLRLRYEEGMSVADIARGLGLPQKPLYRRIERCLRDLRRSPALADARVQELVGGP